jgi:two-component system sensor kinase FixL
LNDFFGYPNGIASWRPNFAFESATVTGKLAHGLSRDTHTGFGIPNYSAAVIPNGVRTCRVRGLGGLLRNAVFICATTSWNPRHAACAKIVDNPAIPADPIATNDLVRRLSSRYLFVLIAVASLIIVDQAIIQPLLIRLDRYAPAINLSGRQRMLSQKLSKSSLAIQQAPDERQIGAYREELGTTLEQWTAAHHTLQNGDPESGIPQITSPQIHKLWGELNPHFEAMALAASELSELQSNEKASTQSELIAVIFRHEAQFLGYMEQIVKAMESEAAREVSQLRGYALAISAGIVSLLLGLGWFVVRPATSTIRKQVDELEDKITERTAELQQAFLSLELEVSQRHEMEIKNQRLAAQLAHADRVETIGHLALGLAHEINHPLAAIANYAEASDVLLSRPRQDVDQTKLKSFLTHIRAASLRGGEIVRRIRNFVQPHLGTTVEVDIHDLLEEVIGLCKSEIDRAGVRLAINFSDRLPHVVGDPIQIQQVVINLIQNALQAMTGQPVGDRGLEIRTTQVDHMLQISALDGGPGFRSGEIDDIFEPFHTTKCDGLGIGLSICRSIIENHGGRIWAENLSVGGASVSFTLPIIPSHDSRLELQTHHLCR